LPRQPLGDQRSGNAAADDQRIAFQVLGDGGSVALFNTLEPRRAAAAQVGLLGLIGLKRFDGDTLACSPYEAKRNTGMLFAGVPDFASLHPGYRAFSSTVGDL
jgi:hypothetical protein